MANLHSLADIEIYFRESQFMINPLSSVINKIDCNDVRTYDNLMHNCMRRIQLGVLFEIFESKPLSRFI